VNFYLFFYYPAFPSREILQQSSTSPLAIFDSRWQKPSPSLTFLDLYKALNDQVSFFMPTRQAYFLRLAGFPFPVIFSPSPAFSLERISSGKIIPPLSLFSSTS